MLALLSAPRGRVSAARVAARARESAQPRARIEVLRVLRPLAAPAAPEYHPQVLTAAGAEPVKS